MPENVLNGTVMSDTSYISFMIRIDVVVPENDVEAISQALKNKSRWHYYFESQR